MINQQLLSYIKQQIQEGKSLEQIKSSLISIGWQIQDIDEAFSFIQKSDNQSSNNLQSVQMMPASDSAARIFAHALSIYKKHFTTFLGITLIPFVFLISIQYLASKLFLTKSLNGVNLYQITILGLLFFLSAIIIKAWESTALIYTVKDSQEKIGIIEAYRRGKHKIISFLWIYFLSGIITFGGFLLFAIPGIIFTIGFSLAPYILVTEDLSGMNVLLKSREYVKGKFGWVVGKFIFSGSVYLLIISIILLILFAISNTIKIQPDLKNIIAYVGSFIIYLILDPLATAYNFLIYSNLKELKGEFVFSPTMIQKIKYIAFGLIGVLLLIATLFFTILSIRNGIEKYRELNRQSKINEQRFNKLFNEPRKNNDILKPAQ